MRRTPWLIVGLSVILGAAVAFFNFARGYEECLPERLAGASRPPSRCVALSDAQRHLVEVSSVASAGILVCTILLLGLGVADRLWGGRAFRRDKIRAVLDQIAQAQVKGQSRHHRLTLYKEVGGLRALLIANWRLRHIEGEEDRRYKKIMVRRIRLGARYLYVYARATRAVSEKSCTVWRVYRDKSGSEGVAGRVWEEDFVVLRDLPKFKPSYFRTLQSLEQGTEDVRRYADEVRAYDIAPLQAMQNYAHHFMGTVIQRADGKRWGILLLDSLKEKCPFPDTKKHVEAEFRSYAKIISLLLP